VPISQVAAHYKFHPETLGLAVNYMDRYCAQQSVAVRHFQLVGVTALLLAAKMRELTAPNLHQLAELCCGAAERSDIKVFPGWANAFARSDGVSHHALLSFIYVAHAAADGAAVLLSPRLAHGRHHAARPAVLSAAHLPPQRRGSDYPAAAQRAASRGRAAQYATAPIGVTGRTAAGSCDLCVRGVDAVAGPFAVTAPASLLALATIICSLAALRLLRPSTAEPLLTVSGARLVRGLAT